jgi:molybdopterin converting factor small subunit
MKKSVTVRFFGFLGGQRGTHTQAYQTEAETVRQLLHEVQADSSFQLTTNIVKAAINDEFVDWDTPIHDGDRVTLLPPFSGG